jgi:hypothetical protein
MAEHMISWNSPNNNWNGTFMSITSGSIYLINTHLKDITIGEGEYGVINIELQEEEICNIINCIFERCKCLGAGMHGNGAPINIICNNGIFEIKKSKFIECNAKDDINTQALYVKISSEENDFKIDNISFYYNTPTTNKLVLLGINNVPDIANINFYSKFIYLCPYLNETNFIINETTSLFSMLLCLDPDVYIGNNGEDKAGCGNDSSNPCRTISYGYGRMVSSSYYEERHILLLYVDGNYTIENGCEIGDITVESAEGSETDDVILVTESSFKTIDFGGVFSITNTASIRFHYLIFNLPS